MADSPNKYAKDLVSYRILSGGSPIKDTYQVFRISVDYALNRIPSATISLMDGDVVEMDFNAANSTDFIPGAEIEIEAGYDGDTSSIFEGIVVSMQISLDEKQGSVLEVTCRDKAILMTETRQNAFYTKVKDSDVITTLINKQSGLTADVDSTTFEHPELIQFNTTDWDFMMLRADVNGLVASINHGKVSVKKPDVNSSPVLSLTNGVDLMAFKAELNAVDQVTGVEAFSWDVSNQSVTSSTGSEPQGPSIGNLDGKKMGSDLGISAEKLQSSAQVQTALLQSWADAKMMKARLASLTGSATFPGSSLALPDTIIEISGVGDRFSGSAFTSAVSHLIEEGIWTTTIRFGMEEKWFASMPDVNALPASGLMPKMGGLMIGKVIKLDADPLNQSRIQVKLPMVLDSSAVWARLASYYATNMQGNFFIPEIDDEVILGFLNEDPNDPIILGSLYSSVKTPPYSLTKENYTKAVTTKSGCKIEFNDEKKVILIQTPSANKITFSDEDKSIVMSDQNNNTIQTSSDGITIKDANGNKIEMTSAGIQISSNSDVKISTSGGDVTVSGLNVTNSAQIAMKASGQASAELSASGQTTVKGAMVMIN